MSDDDDIVKPVENPKKKRGWIWRTFMGLIAVFVGIHLYALALKIIPIPGTILMAQRAMSGEDVKRQWTRLEDISPFLVSAVMAGEDARFCQHKGIDWDAVQDAISDNQAGKQRRGGSTITQQTAKNVFLWNGGGYIRKIPEAWMASFIDYTWGKKRVMEMYLNVAEWGNGLFGAEAAARARFNKPAKDLTPREAALLAAVLPSPNKWRVNPPGNYVNGRANILEARLYVVRNEGYANCVLGRPAKRMGPAPKPSSEAETETETVIEPDLELVPSPLSELAPLSEPETGPDQDSSIADLEITEDPLEPAIETQVSVAPESEDDEGIIIEPQP